MTNGFPNQNDFILHYRKCCALQAGRRESPAFNYDSTLSFTDNSLFVIKGGKNEMYIADFFVCTNEQHNHNVVLD